MTNYEYLRFDELNKYKNNKVALRFLPEPEKLEWEEEREDGLTEVKVEDYIPYVPGSYESLLFPQRLYYFRFLKHLPNHSTEKLPSGWAKRIETDIFNLISDFSEHIDKVNKDNDNIIKDDFTGFGDSLEDERCITKVKLDVDSDILQIDVLNSLDVELFSKVPLLYLDDVFLGLIMLTKKPTTHLVGLTLKKEFDNGFEGKGLRLMFIKFLTANIISESIRNQEKKNPGEKLPDSVKDAFNQGAEMGVEILTELFELTPKYYDL